MRLLSKFLAVCLLMWAPMAIAWTWTLEDGQGNVRSEFTLAKDQVSIRCQCENGRLVLHSVNKGDKRQYFDGNGKLVAEIKSDGTEKFKLRTPNQAGEIKVKGDLEKLKIIVNNNEDRPLKIKRKNEKLKVYEVDGFGQEQFLGQVQMEPERKGIRVKDGDKIVRYRTDELQFSSAYGALLDQRISDELRYILVAEIMIRQAL